MLTVERYKTVFGVPEVVLPLRGFPEGRVRLRLRHDELPLVRVRGEFGIREFYVKEVDGFWEPMMERGANVSVLRKTEEVTTTEESRA